MECRSKVRERHTGDDCSIPISTGPATPPHAAPHLVLTFRFGRQVILCKPTWSGAQLATVQFSCPHCWQAFTTAAVRLDRASGALTLVGCVHCTCGLHLHVDDGVGSLFLPHYLLCPRGRALA
jgi:hypothetical protein